MPGLLSRTTTLEWVWTPPLVTTEEQLVVHPWVWGCGAGPRTEPGCSEAHSSKQAVCPSLALTQSPAELLCVLSAPAARPDSQVIRSGWASASGAQQGWMRRLVPPRPGPNPALSGCSFSPCPWDKAFPLPLVTEWSRLARGRPCPHPRALGPQRLSQPVSALAAALSSRTWPTLAVRDRNQAEADR